MFRIALCVLFWGACNQTGVNYDPIDDTGAHANWLLKSTTVDSQPGRFDEWVHGNYFDEDGILLVRDQRRPEESLQSQFFNR